MTAVPGADATAAMEPVRMGSVGLGGYAGHVCGLLLRETDLRATKLRLTAVCEPDQARFGEQVGALRQRGIKVFTRYEDLLAEPIEGLWLPLPIDLHRPYAEQAFAAGKAVLCEKPLAGSVDDVDAMIAARDRARQIGLVGFQRIYDPSTAELKRHLVAGDIGQMTSATLCCCGPRDSAYYGRSTWAGKFQRNGTWVMDSPAANAMAHYVHLALFLLGPTLTESAVPESVEAELYRANPSIENYDTISMRLHLPGGTRLVVLMTHACGKTIQPHMILRGERGSATFVANNAIEIRDAAGSILHTLPSARDTRPEVAQRFAEVLRGTCTYPAHATFETARAHVVACNGASEAAPVRPVPASDIDLLPALDASDATITAIRNIEQAFATCAESGQLLHESKLFGWTSPAGRKDLRGYRHFAGPARA